MFHLVSIRSYIQKAPTVMSSQRTKATLSAELAMNTQPQQPTIVRDCQNKTVKSNTTGLQTVRSSLITHFLVLNLGSKVKLDMTHVSYSVLYNNG